MSNKDTYPRIVSPEEFANRNLVFVKVYECYTGKLGAVRGIKLIGEYEFEYHGFTEDTIKHHLHFFELRFTNPLTQVNQEAQDREPVSLINNNLSLDIPLEITYGDIRGSKKSEPKYILVRFLKYNRVLIDEVKVHG